MREWDLGTRLFSPLHGENLGALIKYVILHLREAEVEDVVVKFGYRVNKLLLLAVWTTIFTAQDQERRLMHKVSHKKYSNSFLTQV